MAKAASGTRSQHSQLAVFVDEPVRCRRHKARARGAEGVTDGQRAAEQVQLVEWHFAHHTWYADALRAELLAVERRQVGQHLAGERLVQLPHVDVSDGEIVAVQQLSDGVGRAKQQLLLRVLQQPHAHTQTGQPSWSARGAGKHLNKA